MPKPHIKLDPLIMLILGAVALAIVAPIHGEAAKIFGIATKLAIALLFFLYGARLSPAEALAGLKHWRLHGVIQAFTFILFPLIGLACAPLASVFGPELYRGILYLTLVPSTVQSSIAFTSIARGNVAGAIVSASASNLIGVFATPLLVMLLMSSDLSQGAGGGVSVDGSVFVDIAVQLLLPFILGQLSRRWVKDVAASKGTKVVDRGSITMVVYSAFSHGMVGGIRHQVHVTQIIGLVVFAIVLVLFMLWLTKTVALRLHFNEADMKAIQFCGTKKSLATGLPMAAVIFGTNGLGLLILPLMIFHQVQLMICAAVASRYAQSATTEALND